jgi:hypothetical protein
MTAIQQAPMESADIRDYNLFMGLYRGLRYNRKLWME